jgi:pyruvate-ferredoxin/flavodoxin oxidoreductase
MRLVVAILEERGQKRFNKLVADLNKGRADLEARVTSLLAASLAGADTDSLAAALGKVTKGKVALSELTSELDGLGKALTVDRRLVSQAAKLAGELARNAGRISSGADGMGRARFGALIAGGPVAERLARFPDHPYWAPVTVELSTEGAALARGLAEGLVAEHVEAIRDLRRAVVHCEGASDASAKLQAIDGLRWTDLTGDERASCPPLLMVGDEDSLVGRGFGALTGLLSSDLPIKVVLLDGLGRIDDSTAPSAVALAHRSAFVLTGSVANFAHLGAGLREAIQFSGPSFIHIHAPSPARHGFAPDATLRQARRALEGRAHVLMRYDPRAEGAFGARISLEGNPALDADFGENTFADWAYGEVRFASHFRLADGADPGATLRGGAVDVSVGRAIARAQQARLEGWNTLREMAGVLNPFAEQLRAAAAIDLVAAHKAELDALRREMEVKVRDARAGFEEDALSRLTDRLMTLSNRATMERS